MLKGRATPRQEDTNMLTGSYNCPRCNGNAIYRTHRRGFDWLMSAIGLRPVRCYTCSKRFYVRWSNVSGAAQIPEARDDHPKVRTQMTAYPD